MRRIAVVVLMCCTLCVAGEEIGEPEELRGLTRIWVDTERDRELRQNIIREIKDDLPTGSPVTFVGRIEDADLLLIFTEIPNASGKNGYALEACKVLHEQSDMRCLWEWRDRKYTGFRRASSVAADAFVREYNRHNR